MGKFEWPKSGLCFAQEGLVFCGPFLVAGLGIQCQMEYRQQSAP